MEQNKDERTQVLDLGLASPDPQFRVASPSGQAGGAAFDLGSGQQSPNVAAGNAVAPVASGNSGFNLSNSASSFGDTSQNVPTIGFQNVFTQDVKMVKQQKMSPVMQVLAAVMVVIFMLVGAAWYVTGDIVGVLANPLEIVNIFGLQDDESVTADSGPVVAPDAASKSAAQVQGPEPSVVAADQQPASLPPSGEPSVWSHVKNELGGELPKRGESLSADQEATFKAGIAHEFNYQRYKTVLDLAAINAPGSEELLRQALDSKKFWIRMRALIALADMGAEVTDSDVREALGNAHGELRARFFKRFEKSACSVGCFYGARAALKYLDSLGREQALKIVLREASDIRNVYMEAATRDQSKKVQKVAFDWLSSNNIGLSAKNNDGAVYFGSKRPVSGTVERVGEESNQVDFLRHPASPTGEGISDPLQPLTDSIGTMEANEKTAEGTRRSALIMPSSESGKMPPAAKRSITEQYNSLFNPPTNK